MRRRVTISEKPGMRVMGNAPGARRIELTAHEGMNIELRVTHSLPINFTSVPCTDCPLWQTLPQTNRTMIATDPEAGQHPWRSYGGAFSNGTFLAVARAIARFQFRLE